MKSAPAGEQPVPDSTIVARQSIDPAALALALQSLIEHGRAGLDAEASSDPRDHDPQALGEDLDEVLAYLLLLTSLASSELAAERSCASGAGEPLWGPSRPAGAEAWVLVRRGCARRGRRPAGVRAMPPSPWPGQAGWERVCDPILQATLRKDPSSSDRLVPGDIALAAAGPDRVEGHLATPSATDGEVHPASPANEGEAHLASPATDGEAHLASPATGGEAR